MKQMQTSGRHRQALVALCLAGALIAPGYGQVNERTWGGKVHGKPRVHSRNEWSEAAKGENLIAGLPAWFSLEPNWHMTRDVDDAFQLTDGKLSERLDDRILYAQDAVAWQQPGPYAIVFDMGEPRPVERFVARFQGGSEHPMIVFPKVIEVIASNDGKKFHSISRIQKLLPGEKDLADWERTFYLEEDGLAYTKTFSLKAGVTARYIGLRVEAPGIFLISDEVAALKASKPTAALESFPSASVLMDSVGARLRAETLYITSPWQTPNWLEIEDTREKRTTENLVLLLDLPKDVQVVRWGNIPGEALKQRVDHGGERIRWELPTTLDRSKKLKALQGPLFVRAEPDDIGGEAKVITQVDGSITQELAIPIRPLMLPQAGRWQDMHISLGWMEEAQAMAWPDFHSAYAHLGFNHVPTFPRRFDTGGAEMPGESRSKEEKLQFLEVSRQNGFRIIYNESPFHVLRDTLGAKHPEILNEIDGKRGKYLSPIYRGELYRAEINRVADLAAEVKSDVIFYDIELWHASVNEAREDLRFQKAAEASGKSFEAFCHSLGSEMLSDLHAAIGSRMKAGDLPMPLIGQYNLQAVPATYHLVFNWGDVYPRWIDFAMPSLYVQGNARRVRETAMRNYEAIRERAYIPWLTPGTYGTYPPEMLEWMIYETLLNGASGLTYYAFGDFDPIHFHYHAQALARLAPYQAILSKGAPVTLESRGNASVSATATAREALIVLGNYGGTSVERMSVKLPNAGPPEPQPTVLDLLTGEPIAVKGGELKAIVPAGKGRLFYVKY